MYILRRFSYGLHVVKHHFTLVLWALAPIFALGLAGTALSYWYTKEVFFEQLAIFSITGQSCIMLSWTHWLVLLAGAFVFGTFVYWYLTSFMFLCQKAMRREHLSIFEALSHANRRLPVIASLLLFVLVIYGALGVVLYYVPLSLEALSFTYVTISYIHQILHILFIFLPIVLALSDATDIIALFKESLQVFFSNWLSLLLGGLLLVVLTFLLGVVAILVLGGIFYLYGLHASLPTVGALTDQYFQMLETSLAAHPSLYYVVGVAGLIFGLALLYLAIAFNIYLISLYRKMPEDRLQ